MELPLVPGPGDFVVLADHHVLGVEQVAGVLIRDVVLAAERLLLNPLVLLVTVRIVIVVIVVIIIVPVLVILDAILVVAGVSRTVHLRYDGAQFLQFNPGNSADDSLLLLTLIIFSLGVGADVLHRIVI